MALKPHDSAPPARGNRSDEKGILISTT